VQADSDAPLDADAQRRVARSELIQAGGWIALGVAVLIGSLRMDRLESQNINPYTVPGLLPALLGIVMMLLGTLLALRSWRRGALEAEHAAFEFDPASARRVALVLALCVIFGVVLVGHGLPFWCAAAIFVSTAIVTLQQPQRRADGRRLGVRDVLVAVVIGLGAGGAITLVFQQVFLVRLP
jgi:hypothetical protein